ncbi:mitochondrial acidic protein mam33-like [Daucus carota subsp. sativus]|uniref:mitochondrial acidic protein mam33-like n=1 Tax=Daucus carota subsp. sativus TaxID=79200 RepID=UPI0030833D54
MQNDKTEPLGDFVVDWDSPRSEDVVLRKTCNSGEELAVTTALLGEETIEDDDRLPREALMKVCIKKPGLSSILQFDCGVFSKGEDGIEFNIRHAHYLPSTSSLGSSLYRGPLFSTLDPQLQDELKQYLVTKGIGKSLTNFLLLHLHKKEQNQYENWLEKLKAYIAQGQETDS